jgi:hypothetical protein
MGFLGILKKDARPGTQPAGDVFGHFDAIARQATSNPLGGIAAAGGGELARLLGAPGAGPRAPVTSTEAAQVAPAEVRTLASAAHPHDASVVDRLGIFCAQDPTLLKHSASSR